MNLKTIADDLLPVYETEKGNRVINARELHEQLLVSTRYNDWINRMIDKYGFVQDEDFYSLLSKTNGRPTTEFLLTIDTAKEIAMVQNNEAGRAIRKYFIEVEKRHRKQQIDTSQLSPELQILDRMVKSLAHQEYETKLLKNEIKTTNSKVDNITEIIKFHPKNWRSSVNKVINSIAIQHNKSFSELRTDSYELLEQRAKCKLSIRLENLRKNLAFEGASKSRIDKSNKMDVIEADPRLTEIYLSIIKELAIQYQVNVTQLEGVN